MSLIYFIKNFFKKVFFQREYEKNSEYSEALEIFKGDLIVTEILNGSDVVDELFLQVFGHPAPRHGIHVVTFCRMSDGSYRVANYLNYWIKGDACYIGGAVTDKNLLRHNVNKELRGLIKKQGGFAKISIMHVLDKNVDKVKVFFGHTAVPQILKIIDGLGFKSTDQVYLHAKWAPDVTAAQQRKLLAEAAKVGAF